MSKVNGTMGRSDCYAVDPRTISIKEGWNPRCNWGNLDELKESIKTNGVKVPLTLKRNKNGVLEVLDGERRLTATMAAIAEGAEIVSIPAFIKPANYSEIEALVDAFVNNDGERFDSLSEAEGYRRFLAYGWTQAKIASRVGRSVGHVNSILKLLEASPELQNAITSGEVKPTLAIQIIKAEQKDPKASTDYQAKAVAQVKAGEKEAVTKAVKKPNSKHLKALTNSIIEFFETPKDVVKSFEEFMRPVKKGLDASEAEEALQEAYNLGRIVAQAEALGYSISDLPELLREDEVIINET